MCVLAALINIASLDRRGVAVLSAGCWSSGDAHLDLDRCE